MGPLLIRVNNVYMSCMYTENMYNGFMIRSFADKETEKIFNQEYSRKIPENIQKTALRKLMMIDAAEKLSDLRILPANHFQWRIVFIPSDGGRYYDEVKIIDYH